MQSEVPVPTFADNLAEFETPKEVTEYVSDQDADNDDNFLDEGEEEEQPDEESEDFEVENPSEESDVAQEEGTNDGE